MNITSVPGPVPLSGQSTPSEAAELIRTANTFKEFSHAPAQ